MTKQGQKAWDILGPDTFIHSCNCPICHSLRDDSGRSCLGCRDHHVKAVAADAELKRLREALSEMTAARDECCKTIAELRRRAKEG